MRSVATTLRLVAKLFGTHRKLWVPFLLVAVFEAGLLGLVWLTPHPPFAKVFAPPFRYFFGDRVLHYPAHLWFLYHATKHAHFVASVLVGAFMTGLACSMVRQTHEGAALSFRNALVSRQVRYGTVLLLWVLVWAIARGAVQLLARGVPPGVWAVWMVGGVTLLLQLLFGYAIPAAVFDRVAWWKALLGSLREALRYPFSTLCVIALPSLAVMLFALLVSPARVAEWMRQTAPEMTVPLVAVQLFLWTVADAVMTVALAHLWWVHRASVAAASATVAAAASSYPVRRGPVAMEGSAAA